MKAMSLGSRENSNKWKAGLGSSTVLVLGTCTWYLYLSTYVSVLDVLEYLVCENVKVLVLILDQKVLGT